MRTFLTGLGALLLCAWQASAGEGNLDLLFKGPGNSNARAINAKGSIVGYREVDGDEAGTTQEEPIWVSQGKVKVLPKLTGYTATWPSAISDGDLVAGFASKPMKELGNPGHLNLQAFVWDAKTNSMHGLGVLEGFERSMAFGISADGTRISGICGGAGAIRVCVWERSDRGWECKLLPGNPDSPLLVTSGAAISRDGSSICGVDGINAARWTRQADGSWKQMVLKDDELFVPKAINDSGCMVGYRRADKDGNYHAVVWSDKRGFEDIGVLPGTRSSQALAINNAGLVVGVSDEPGPEGGPQAFVWKDGKLAPLAMPKVIVSYAYAVNDNGQIAGFCGREDDEYVPAFVWTPKAK